MKNRPGKIFEEDFKRSAEEFMMIERLKDPAMSFNVRCQKCKHHKTTFSPKNMCDFFAYSYPYLYLFELKSHAGTSIPFNALKRNKRDNRLKKMAEWGKNQGINAYVVFNWRDQNNLTVAVDTASALCFMEEGKRKSIPYRWTMDVGYVIPSFVRRTRMGYDFGGLLAL